MAGRPFTRCCLDDQRRRRRRPQPDATDELHRLWGKGAQRLVGGRLVGVGLAVLQWTVGDWQAVELYVVPGLQP